MSRTTKKTETQAPPVPGSANKHALNTTDIYATIQIENELKMAYVKNAPCSLSVQPKVDRLTVYNQGRGLSISLSINDIVGLLIKNGMLISTTEEPQLDPQDQAWLDIRRKIIENNRTIEQAQKTKKAAEEA